MTLTLTKDQAKDLGTLLTPEEKSILNQNASEAPGLPPAVAVELNNATYPLLRKHHLVASSAALTSVYFDLETGGVEPHHPDIQLAAIAVVDETGEEVASFEKKIVFDESTADPEALKINHYDPEVWQKTAVAPDLVVIQFARFIDRFKCVPMVSKQDKPYSVAKLVGHNAASFDGPRLKRLFQKYGQFLPADPRVRDTMHWAQFYFEHYRSIRLKSYRLEEVCKAIGVQADGAHDALADVRLSAAVAEAIKKGLRNGR